MNVYFTFTVLLLLFLLYVFDEYLGYLDENEIEYEKETFNDYELYLEYSILIIMIVGFVSYYLKQKKEHSKEFDNLKFLLGTVKCDFKD